MRLAEHARRHSEAWAWSNLWDRSHGDGAATIRQSAQNSNVYGTYGIMSSDRPPTRRSWCADIAAVTISRRRSRRGAMPDAAPASRSATAQPRGARRPRALARRKPRSSFRGGLLMATSPPRFTHRGCCNLNLKLLNDGNSLRLSKANQEERQPDSRTSSDRVLATRTAEASRTFV